MAEQGKDEGQFGVGPSVEAMGYISLGQAMQSASGSLTNYQRLRLLAAGARLGPRRGSSRRDYEIRARHRVPVSFLNNSHAWF